MNKAQRGVEKRQEKGNVRGLNKIASVLRLLPAAVIAGVAHMEVSGNHEVVLEGCGGIIEYTDDVVRVKTGKSIARFCPVASFSYVLLRLKNDFHTRVTAPSQFQ